MRSFWIIVLLTIMTSAASAQEGFEADRLSPCLGPSGVVSTCRPVAPAGLLSAGLGLDWSYHLLAVETADGLETRWVVEQRTSVRTGLAVAAHRRLVLSAGLDGVIHQSGWRTDARGASLPISGALGRTWLGLLALAHGESWPVRLGLGVRLVLPALEPAALAAPARPRWHLTLLMDAPTEWLQPALNIGFAFGENIHYRDVTRDETLYYRLGSTIGRQAWPAQGLVELSGVTRLEAPFQGRTGQTLEGLAGLMFRPASGTELLLVTAWGVVGPSAPAVRILALIRMPIGPEKRRF
jgi:hypothetical protein